MQVTSAYNQPSPAIAKTAVSILTTETEIAVVTDLKYTPKSQLTAYFAVTPGSATNVKIRYYYTPDGGTNWYQVPVKNTSTGILIDTPTIIDATSPTQSGVWKTIEDIPVSGSMGIKVTGQATGATATLSNFYLFVRDN